eukprot:4245130-Ditylum_brightwellii.AAC.1
MVEAITNYSHTLYARVNTSSLDLACLSLLAPLPMAFEASLLSAEMLFPEEVTSFYGELPRDEKETYVQHRLG